ncbi:MAG: M48 family peptidase [Candidatus Acidiferrales bacterium]
MRRSAVRRDVPGGPQIFSRMFTRLGCTGRSPTFLVEFRPYAGLSLTIRLREDRAHVRLSDVLRGAPRIVLEAAAAILLGKLYRRTPPEELLDGYRTFSNSHKIRSRLLLLRRKRVRNALALTANGERHNLREMYARLNSKLFAGTLAAPRLGWSHRVWRAQLGCYDPALEQIVINKRLDRPDVPAFVVEYVLFHEMLHQKHPLRYERCRLRSHSREFRKEEQRFKNYHPAMRFLKRLR